MQERLNSETRPASPAKNGGGVFFRQIRRRRNVENKSSARDPLTKEASSNGTRLGVREEGNAGGSLQFWPDARTLSMRIEAAWTAMSGEFRWPDAAETGRGVHSLFNKRRPALT